MRDLQQGFPERPEPSAAPKRPQPSMEAKAAKQHGRGEEEGVRLP